jgi:spermidine synthase
MNALGRHILVEYIGCSAELLNDVSYIENGMLEAAKEAGATVINSTFHHFSPYGVSGVVVIQESHLAIHTWPEYQYAAVDLFTCGDTVDPWVSFDKLKKIFKAQNHSALEMQRGSLSLLNRIPFKQDLSFRSQQGNSVESNKKQTHQFKRELWFTDKDENQALSLRYSGDVLFNEKSPYQTVRVFETNAYGKMLTIDNLIMCTERDEFHYHECIVHPAAQTFGGNPKNALVIGGGDGGTIRELFKYPSIEKVTMVEIDETVIRASKQFLPTLSSEFSNPKLDLIIGDGIEYVAKAKDSQYDLVIVDGSDPKGPAEGLFTETFFQNCYRILKPNGILTTQSESPMFMHKAFVDLYNVLSKIFGKNSTHIMLFFAPTYPSGMWSIQMGIKGNTHPLKDINFERIDIFSKETKLRYYNSEIHKALFALPTFVKNLCKIS